MRRNEIERGVLLSIAVMLTYMYFRNVHWPHSLDRAIYHLDTIRGLLGAPYRYRILVPYVAEPLRAFFALLVPGTFAVPVLAAYLVVDFASLLFTFMMLQRLLRLWFDERETVILLLMGALSVAVGMRDHFFQPASWLEPGLIAAAMIALHFQRRRLVLLLVILGTLNRETAVLIAGMAVMIDFTGHGMRRAVSTAALLGPAWLLTFISLRWLLGDVPAVWSLDFIWQLNTRPYELVFALGALIAAFAALWVWAPRGWRHAPALVRASAVIVPADFLLFAVWGHWVEVRLLTTLLPVVLPLAGFYLFRSADAAAPDHHVAPIQHS